MQNRYVQNRIETHNQRLHDDSNQDPSRFPEISDLQDPPGVEPYQDLIISQRRRRNHRRAGGARRRRHHRNYHSLMIAPQPAPQPAVQQNVQANVGAIQDDSDSDSLPDDIDIYGQLEMLNFPDDEEAEEESACCHCMVNKAKVVLHPCLHACLCLRCKAGKDITDAIRKERKPTFVSSCPLCRTVIQELELTEEYIRLVCQMKMAGAICKQSNTFLSGFYDIIMKRVISDRAKFLQFVTETSKVLLLLDFSTLEGFDVLQKLQIHRNNHSTDRLPLLHAWFSQQIMGKKEDQSDLQPSQEKSKPVLKLYNSFTRRKEKFIPQSGNEVRWYCCEPTVYDNLHMDHARCYTSFDTFRRVLSDYLRHDVTHTMNITDTDDKTIKRARQNYSYEKYAASNHDPDVTLEDTKKMMQSPAIDIEGPTDANKKSMLSKMLTNIKHSIENLETAVKSNNKDSTNMYQDNLPIVSRDAPADWLDKRQRGTVTDNVTLQKPLQHWETEFHKDMDAPNVIRLNVLPRVSEHAEIVLFISYSISKLSAIKRILSEHTLDMEIIVNPKKLDNGLNIIQLETAVGAGMKSFEGSIGIYVPRSRFLPAKKIPDLPLVKSNLYVLKNGSLLMSPKRMFPVTPLIKLDDNHFAKVAKFTRRFASIPDLLELDHLTVSGDVTFGRGVSLRGTVVVIANHGERVDLPSGTISENKIVSGNLRILDH